MNQADAATLLDYNYWATGHVLRQAAQVGPGQFIASGNAQTASLRETLVHILSAERLWRTRLQTGASSPTLRAEDCPTVGALREFWEEEERGMRAYLATLDDGALERPVQFRRHTGELSAPLTRWHTIMQMVNHGTQHRSEAAVLLTAYGRSPGNLDFLFYVLGLR